MPFTGSVIKGNQTITLFFYFRPFLFARKRHLAACFVFCSRHEMHGDRFELGRVLPDQRSGSMAICQTDAPPTIPSLTGIVRSIAHISDSDLRLWCANTPLLRYPCTALPPKAGPERPGISSIRQYVYIQSESPRRTRTSHAP